MERKRQRKGFTLVELLVALIIVAIIVAGGWVFYSSKVNGARATKIADEVSKIETALNLFEQQTGYLPSAINELWVNQDSSGNPIPGWSGPYIMPPGGDTTATSLKSGSGATITVTCDSTNGEQIVFTGVPQQVAEDYDKQYDDGDLNNGLVTYDATNHVLKITFRKTASCI
jgi:prepilin-type N-terminal cleavage/methylation domain-containing protein